MFKGAVAKGVAKKAVKGANAALDEEAVDALFNSLADEDDPECINMDGIGNFCEMLEMDPSTDVRLLVLLWKMAAISKPGMVTRKEFTTGMLTTFKKDSAEGLKSILSTLDPGFLERGPFREFYRYVFQFSREGNICFPNSHVPLQTMLTLSTMEIATHAEEIFMHLADCISTVYV